jgi:hypothetical protein
MVVLVRLGGDRSGGSTSILWGRSVVSFLSVSVREWEGENGKRDGGGVREG